MYRFFLLLVPFLIGAELSSSEPFVFWNGKLITQSRVSFIKQFDAWGIIKHLRTLPSAQNRIKNVTNFIPEYEYLCRMTYCHDENPRSPCGKLCSERAPKVDYDVMEKKMRAVSSSDPALDKESCKNECAEFCGQNDCDKECSFLCAVHFSYANRREYEQEFRMLMMSIFNHTR